MHEKDGVTKRFRHKIPFGQENEPWHTTIVMSNMPPNHLPHSAKHTGVKQVCTLEVTLDPCDMVLKNDKWYHYRRIYRCAEFDVRLLVGTGLHFEIWGRNGCKSKSHEEIEVEWEMPDLPGWTRNGNLSAAYRSSPWARAPQTKSQHRIFELSGEEPMVSELPGMREPGELSG